MLVDQGKIDLDEPVSLRGELPAFRMKDESVSLKVTPRDILSHRTGIATYY